MRKHEVIMKMHNDNGVLYRTLYEKNPFYYKRRIFIPTTGLTSSRKSAGVFVPPGPLCSVPPALPTLQPLLKFTEASGLLIAGPLQGPCPSFSRSHRKV